MPNYDTTNPGVLYVRAHRIEIDYPEPGAGLLPTALIRQSEAVKLADGTTVKVREIDPLSRAFDMVNDGNDPSPLVNIDTGQPLAAEACAALAAMVASGHVSLNIVMLALLAVVRKEQTRVQ